MRRLRDGEASGSPRTSREALASGCVVSARIDRFSPVRLEVLYALPTGSAKLFMIAAAEGRSMNPAGTFDKMGAGQVPIGVWVGETHRDRILGTLKLSLSRWRYAVRQGSMPASPT